MHRPIRQNGRRCEPSNRRSEVALFANRCCKPRSVAWAATTWRRRIALVLNTESACLRLRIHVRKPTLFQFPDATLTAVLTAPERLRIIFSSHAFIDDAADTRVDISAVV